MASIILLNKPFNVLSQFTSSPAAQGKEPQATLKPLLPNSPGFYVAGRLDYDSEGLLLLTDNGALQHQITDPKHKLPKTYWVQVEGAITAEALTQLQQGVILKDGKTRPAKAKALAENTEEQLWPRNPPIRERQSIPTSWLELTIKEGKNRQVRRMTAAVGFPTLRLVRISIGPWQLSGLSAGEHRIDDVHIANEKPAKPATGKPKAAAKNNRARRTKNRQYNAPTKR